MSSGSIRQPVQVDYTIMDSPTLLAVCGVDAVKWAAAFCQIAGKHGHNLDEDWMVTWFANAMMAMHDHVKGRSVTVLPDGSAFFVATSHADEPRS